MMKDDKFAVAVLVAVAAFILFADIVFEVLLTNI